MIELRPTPLATVSPGVPALLQEGYYVKFSDAWPASLSHVTKQVGGKTQGRFFKISVTNQVPLDLSYKIPAGDFRDVDFGNVGAGPLGVPPGLNENLYPTNPQTLYEIQLGFKPANVLAFFYVPSGQDVSKLEASAMIPTITSATSLRYLGAKKPADSPYDDRRIFLYTIWNLDAIIMRLFVDTGLSYYVGGVLTPGHDKIVVGLTVNKCGLEEIGQPTPKQLDVAKELKFYSELRW